MLTQTAPEGHPAGGRSDTDGPAAVEVTVAPAAEPLITECRPHGIRQIKKFAVSVPRQNGSLQEVWRWEDDTRKLREKDYKKAISRALQFFERHHGKPANKAKAIRDLTDAVKRAAAAAERHREQQRADGGPAPTNTDVMPAVGESAGTATGAEPSVLAAAVAAKDREPAGTSEIGLEADASRGARGEVVTIGRNHDGPLLSHHRKELEEGSGLSAATIAEAEFRSIPAGDPETAELLNWKKPNPKLGAALVMPLGGDECPAQVKFDDPRTDAKGKPVKYESPVGSKPDVYIPPDARDGVLTTKAPVVITEGVKKALKAVQEGILTIALLGVSMFKVKGEQRLIPGLERIDWDGREAVICYDSDGRTNRSVGQAAAELAALLEAKGAEVKVLFLPPGEGGKKVGLDDLLMERPAEEVKTLIAEAGPPGSVEDAGRRKAGKVDPEELGRIAAEALAVDGAPTLRKWRKAILLWDGARFSTVERDEAEEAVLNALTPHVCFVNGGHVGNAMMHLSATTRVPGSVDPGHWIGTGPAGWDDPADIFAAADALVHVPRYLAGEPAVLPPTPHRLTLAVSSVPFDPAAPEPTRWTRFLSEVLPGRPGTIRLLQQWFGYVLTGDTSLQKMLVAVGRRRSGKGTIFRVMTELIGPNAVSGSTLSDLGGRFGLEPLVGKSVMLVGDSRPGESRAARSFPVENLLRITGEDVVNVDGKGVAAFSTRLRCRIVIATNKAPVLPDASGAVAARFLPIEFRECFDGREDPHLEAKLNDELPGILLWAIAGLKDLRESGRFVEPAETARLRERIAADANPVAAFVAECCDLEPGVVTLKTVLRERYAAWCSERGLPVPDVNVFGEELINTCDRKVKPVQRRVGGVLKEHYEGIALTHA